MIAKKIGRPTDSLKETRITVRLDKDSEKILNDYLKKYNKTKAESIRDAIKMLEEK